MALSARLIRRRIKSVGNTKKITKAMQLISASKMRKATASALASRAYASAGRKMIVALAGRVDQSSHPLLTERPAARALVILVSSHRGLAGGFNANVIRRALEFVRDPAAIPGASADTRISFVTVGRKGEDALRRLDKAIIASFPALGDVPRVKDVYPIAALAREEFVKGNFDRVYLVYTDFVSAVAQKPRVRQLLPISLLDIEALIAGAGQKAEEAAESEAVPAEDMLFEPSTDLILEAILPRMTDVQLYQALLESSASEHSARMLAMQNASDAASDMIDDLTFTLNQARQAAITREISEIAASKATLEG